MNWNNIKLATKQNFYYQLKLMRSVCVTIVVFQVIDRIAETFGYSLTTLTTDESINVLLLVVQIVLLQYVLRWCADKIGLNDGPNSHCR